jgi:pyruvate/2-oxoglutarate dehydrogenase complex dihydrolipoamide acyltransferase (E2) component
MLDRFSGAAPAVHPSAPGAVGGSLLGRFGSPEAAQAAPSAPAGGSLLNRFGSSAPAPAPAAGGSILERFGSAPPAAPPPEPEAPPPPPEPGPAAAAPVAEPAVDGRWERGLHELFSGVRRQAAFIAGEELFEHVAAAVEEVRKL